MHNRIFSIAFLTLLLVTVPRAQQDPPANTGPEGTQAPPLTFKAEVNYVEVDATVLDGQGNFLEDLTRNDFQIFEDGKPQTLSTFARVNIPVEREQRPLFSPTAIEPDVRSNKQEFSGRLYVMVLDDLHTYFERTPRVRAAARRFVERYMGANDLMAVLHIQQSAASQEFTSSQRALIASIDKFSGRKLRSPTLERVDEYNRTAGLRDQGSRVNDPLDAERGFEARNMLQSLKNVADWLGGVHGRRKALILFSEGIDYDIYDVFNNQYASTILDEARDAIGGATRANVNIYAIDPRGLTTAGDLDVEVSSYPDDRSLGIGPASLNSELRLSQDSLRTLSEETGGFAAVNSNDFSAAFDRVVRNNSSYYLLGYYPANERRDGRFRKIEVRVTRPGVTVNARKGYVAPRGRAPQSRVEGTTTKSSAGTSSELREVLDSPMPVSGLGLEVFAAAFKGTDANGSVAVAVQLDGRGLTFRDKGGLFQDSLELSLLAVDVQNKVGGGDRQAVELTLKPETHQAVLQNGFRLLSRFELPPGRYQLRVAAREAGGGRVGSVYYDLDVPAFAKSPMSMSGLVLTSASAPLTPTAKHDEQLRQVLPGPPTTAREFGANDELALFVDIYDNVTNPVHKVDIKTSLLTTDGRVLFSADDVRDSSEFAGGKGGYGHTGRIPLKALTPGIYVLRVEAQSRAGQSDPVIRQVQFRIRPPAPAAGGAAGASVAPPL